MKDENADVAYKEQHHSDKNVDLHYEFFSGHLAHYGASFRHFAVHVLVLVCYVCDEVTLLPHVVIGFIHCSNRVFSQHSNVV